MPVFISDYCSDLGKTYSCVGLTVKITDFANNFLDFPNTELLKYLPSFYSSLKPGKGNNYCSLDIYPRLFYLSIGESLKIQSPLPFCPLSSEFNQAFQEIKENNLIAKIEYKGEKIPDDFTRFLVRNV